MDYLVRVEIICDVERVKKKKGKGIIRYWGIPIND